MINHWGEENRLDRIILMGLSFVLFTFTFNIPSSIAFMVVCCVGLIRPSISAACIQAHPGHRVQPWHIAGYDSLGGLLARLWGIHA